VPTEIRFRLSLCVILITALVFVPGVSFAGAGDAASGPPPVPPVLSVTDMGTVVQNPVIYARDGTFSALVNGNSVWTFGDTPMSVPGKEGIFWDDNSLSWTSNLDASHGITLNHDLLDSTGAPSEFLPYTTAEAQYNYTHDKRHCTAKPCGAELAMWGGPVVWDPARNRVLFFYDEIWRVPGQSGWTTVGAGIAVGTPGTNGWNIQRPVENPGSQTPTLMWGQKDVEFTGGSLVVNTTMYSYGCVAGFLIMNCQLAQVPLSGALDKTQWTYYAGNNTWSAKPADAVTVFQGGAAGNSVFYNPYLGMYMAIYSGVFVNDVYYRVSNAPWGPWSDQTLLFTGQSGWNNTADYAAEAHVEFAQGNGQTQYVTYVHATGLLRQDLPLVQVVFGQPAK